MARINNVFNQGKMNKDLDERVIPNGQYRHAMNVQLSTSDGSNTGVIQNLLGNQMLSQQINISNGICVGSIVDEGENAIYWFVTDDNRDMILEYKNGITKTVFNDPSREVLKYKDVAEYGGTDIITGINILDNFLFWTDNESEPKKINIPNSISGTDQADDTAQTKLVINNTISATNVTEDHITVIKKSPKYPPLLEMSDGRRQGFLSATINYDFSGLQVGDQINIQDDDLLGNGIMMSWFEDDIIVLQYYDDNVPVTPLTEYQVKLQIVNINHTPGGVSNSGLPIPPDTDYDLEIISISNNTPLGLDISTGLAPSFVIDLFESIEKIFEFKFPRFAYRWRYIDKEYSTFSPFSEVAFLPGVFDYHPKKGYNIGMTNNLAQLFIKEFVTPDIPEDVVAIDILYKESNSANVYVVDTIRKNDPNISDAPYNGSTNAWTFQNADATYPGILLNRDGRYEIKSETIYATLPANQLLRVYDTVPRKALAQEITGNRLIYGNYVQNYDLDNLVANFNVNLKTFENVRNLNQPLGQAVKIPNKSLKSIRDYQVGVIYLDQYGRQTPILSSSTGVKKISKAFADNYNQLQVRCKHDPPSFATSFKFYIKEISGEFYNLALDRYYDAEDENIWLSFPSSDRNKIDIDTFLILKKGTESNDLVKEKARYKVLAIENQAPDYIKRNELPLGLEFHNNTDNDIFTQDSTKFPLQSRDFFSLNYEPFKNSSLDNIHKLLETLLSKEEIQVQFKNTSTQQASRKYRITNISASIDASTGIPEPGTQVDFKVDPAFEGDVVFAYDETNNQIKNITSVSFEKVIVENKPEFDGKFFVKILTDDIIKKHLEPAITADTQYRTVASRKIYYRGSDFLNIHSNGETTLNATNYHINGVEAANFSAPTGTGRRNDLWDYWYKFCAYARQSHQHYPAANRVAQSVDVTQGTYQDVWFINDYNWIDQSSGINDTSGSYSTEDHTNSGANYLQNKTGNGITSWTNNSRIEISITGLEPDPDNIQTSPSSVDKYYTDDYNDDDGWTIGTSSIYNVGEGNINEVFSTETSFVNSLFVGNTFRWKEDPTGTVYTITSITRRYLLEYNGDDSNTTHNRYRRPENYTTSWVMYLDKPIAWDPTNPNDGQEAMNGFSPNTNPYAEFAADGTTSNSATSGVTWSGISIAQGYNLEFVEPLYDDKIMPTNPSIFETEPKEQVDLDIYYEASQEYPITLTTDNFPNVIKIGSNVTLPTWNTTDNLGSGDAVVVGFSNDQIRLLSNNWTGLSIAANTILQFTTSGKTINLEALSYTTPDPVTQEVLLEVKTDLHDSPIELDFFNCYSFANGVESNRIRDNFNAVTIDKGAVVSTTLDDENLYNEDRKTNGLIFSGIYNSVGGVNELNQFVQAEKITKDINPTYGSVQKLFSRNTDLIAFCEDRVIKILANKDAVFNADGNPQLTANQNVLGQTIPFVGDYGISKNPESFASESYRAYFADKQRGAVLRLSMDGLTAISNDGMRDYFGEKLKEGTYIIGSYDNNKEEYNLTVWKGDLTGGGGSSVTVSYDEKVKGWTSFKSFIPESGCGIQNDYFTFKRGNIYKHHVPGTTANEFYGVQKDSRVRFIFNQDPSMIKSFNSIMYEGSQGKVQRGAGYTDNNFYGYKSLYNKKGWYVQTISTEKGKGNVLNFLEKEDKWFGSIRGKSNGVNDIDLKNFSVQGIGTISSIDVVVPPYTLNAGNITLSNPSNTFNTSTIDYSFTPATQTGSVAFPITYTVEVNTGTQGLQTLMTVDQNGNPTSLHEPNTVYNHVVSSNTNPADPDNNHTFIVTATDSNGQTVGGFNFMNSISTLAIPPLAMNAPVLTINTNTSSSVIIDLDVATATGGYAPYTYTGEYVQNGGVFNIYPAPVPGIQSVNILPTPNQAYDIDFNITVTDSQGNSIVQTSTINAGVSLPPVQLGPITFLDSPPTTPPTYTHTSYASLNYISFGITIETPVASNLADPIYGQYTIDDIYWVDQFGVNHSIVLLPSPVYNIAGDPSSGLASLSSITPAFINGPIDFTTFVNNGNAYAIDDIFMPNPPSGINTSTLLTAVVTVYDINTGLSSTGTATLTVFFD